MAIGGDTAASVVDLDLRPYVSELTRSWMGEAPDARTRTRTGTLVFADISGFTRLTERLAARGRVGAEEMSDHLDDVLSALLEAAYGYGGWLVKWGGDALLLMFEGPDHPTRAVAAAAAMRARIRTVGSLDTSVGRVRLRMSISAHTGEFDFHLVGRRHRELLITGSGATVTAQLEAAAQAGEILLSASTAAALPAAARGPTTRGGVLLARVPAAVAIGPAVPSGPPDVAGLLPELIYAGLAGGGGAGEHRQVAVAFLEFSGLDALGSEQGPAAVGAALDRLVTLTQEACHRNQVSFHETDIAPDGGKIMLVAGAPRALEDPAGAMLRTLREVVDEPDRLAVRAGVTVGRVFAGSVGPPARRSYSVKGDVVNLAARIMGKTPIGAIWVLPEVTAAAHTRFDLTDIPPFTVKGKIAPVRVQAVGRARGERVDASPELPLIGRDEELARLRAAMQDARAGRGRHLEVIGEAGIGKSRLLGQVRDEALAAGLRVVVVRADLYRASAPYSLVRGLVLDALAEFTSPRPAGPELTDRLRDWVETVAPGRIAQLPLLGPVLDHSIADTAETHDLAPEFRIERRHELVDALLAGTLTTPTVVLVDNLQFADEASVALLRHLCTHVGTRPWLLAFGQRQRPEVPDVLELGPLSESAAAQLLDAATRVAPLSPHVADAVIARAGGNPLFLRQLAAAAPDLSGASELPDTIETVVAARIDGLRPVSRDLLRAAAVLGIAVDPELLAAALSVDDVSTRTALAELSEFLGPDGTQLRFRQPLIRDTAYAGLSFRRRAELHGRVADLLNPSGTAPGEELGALLSLHYFRAGRYEAALSAARAAGDRAAEVYANSEAVLLYQRATDAAARLATDTSGVRAELLEKLGDVQWRLGEYAASDHRYAAARRLVRADRPASARVGLKTARSAERRGRYDLALRRLAGIRRQLAVDPALTDPALSAEVALRTGFAQFRRGRMGLAQQAFEVVIATETGRADPMVVAEALAILDVVEINQGRIPDGQRAQRALATYEAAGDLAGQASTCTQIGYTAYFAGRWVEAATAYSRARALFVRLGDLAQAAVNDANTAELLLEQGGLDQAERALGQALRIWRAAGADNDIAFGEALLGRVLARQGRFDEADELLRLARDRFAAEGARSEVLDADAYRAESLLLRGAAGAARDLATATLDAGRRAADYIVQEPLLHRIVAAGADALGHRDAADVAWTRALELSRERGAEHELAITVGAMAERAARTGTRLDRALLAEVAPMRRRLGLAPIGRARADGPTGAPASGS